jgi:hypothetical protein
MGVTVDDWFTKEIEEYKNEDGELHRIDGPARIINGGIKQWWINGKLHRLDGPAIIDDESGRMEWYIDDINLTTEIIEWMREADITWPWNNNVQSFFILSWAYAKVDDN